MRRNFKTVALGLNFLVVLAACTVDDGATQDDSQTFNDVDATISPDGKSSASSSSSTIYSSRTINFDNRKSSTYTAQEFAEDFGNVSGYSTDEESRHYVNSGGRMKVKLLANELTSRGGVVARVDIEKGLEYKLKYDVMFPVGFDWRFGGKLPGISGGAGYAGGADTSAGDGWSFRVNWRRYATANNGKPYFVPYAYYYEETDATGAEFGKRFTITPGTWHSVEIRVKMNTGKNNNGTLELNIDGQQVVRYTTFRWVIKDAGREIDQIRWDIFRGGNSDKFKSPDDHTIYFDNISFEKVK